MDLCEICLVCTQLPIHFALGVQLIEIPYYLPFQEFCQFDLYAIVYVIQIAVTIKTNLLMWPFKNSAALH